MNMSFQNTTGLNLDFYNDYEVSSWTVSSKLMRLICVPIIIIVGLVGNTLSLLVFCTRSMKRSSCSVFLAALAAADNTFLLSLLVTLVNGTMYKILTIDFSCQLLIFITYVASFLSVWFIVGFTCERYIAIRFPLKRSFICSVGREKVAVVILSIVACFMYTFSFWTTVAIPSGTENQCTYKDEYFAFLNIATWIDTFITIVMPFLIILCLNSLLVQCILANSKKTARLYTQSRCGDRNAVLHASLPDANNLKYTYCRTVCMRRTKGRMFSSTNPQGRITRTLLFVSLTFLCLNLPSHVLRLYGLIVSEATQYQKVSEDFLFFHELSLMLYYATFGCNFFIYTLYGKNFKRSLLVLLRCKSTMHTERQRLVNNFSVVHTSNTSSV